jgi:hypothetical protein
VRRIYSALRTNNYWKRDLLGSNPLYAGQDLDVIIHVVSNCCDGILVEFENGSSFTRTWDICSDGQYNTN